MLVRDIETGELFKVITCKPEADLVKVKSMEDGRVVKGYMSDIKYYRKEEQDGKL